MLLRPWHSMLRLLRKRTGLGHGSVPARRKPSRQGRPRLETLEDRISPAIQAVSLADPAVPTLSNGPSFTSRMSLSADGNLVAFHSFANNLVAGDTNGRSDVFVRNLQTGDNTLVSTAASGLQGNSNSTNPAISSDGRYVAFESFASTLVPGDTNGRQDVFVKELQTGSITLVSTDATRGQGNDTSRRPSISGDGRYVAFESFARNLVPADTNGTWDIFVKDLQTGALTRVNTDATGDEANNTSSTPSISSDGRYVAFYSYASNLVPGDTNNTADVFVKDLQTGAITRASTTASGGQAASASFGPSISSDGRYVAFESGAHNLVSGDTNGSWDIFVKDLDTDAITRASTDYAGGQANSSSFNASISADGRRIAFYSYATNLVLPDTNGRPDILVKDLDTGVTLRASYGPAGQANSDSFTPSISADGQHVAFRSRANNLVSGDTNNTWDVFVKNLQTGDLAYAGAEVSGLSTANNDSNVPSVSTDGRYVAFQSRATNLVPGDSNDRWDVFVKDFLTGAITRASTDRLEREANGDSNGPSISGDGRYVAYYSTATNLVAGDNNNRPDVFVKDLLTGTVTRASTDATGNEANNTSTAPSLSSDGRYVAFYSYASNLVPGDTNGRPDVFVKDLQTGAITRASTNANGDQANSDSLFPSISGDGRYVAFQSYATNLVAGGTNGTLHVFVKDLQTEAITLVSVNASGDQGNSSSRAASISSDGHHVAFESYAYNLVPGDTNGRQDVFVKDLQDGTITRASTNASGGQGIFDSSNPSISSDGRHVAFQSNAYNLVPGDTNGRYDVFVKDLQTDAITRVSANDDGLQGNNNSFGPSISGNGSQVAFYSLANNLVPGDSNFRQDVFFWTGNSAPTDLQLSPAAIPENEPAGTSVGTLSTTDPDPVERFTYTLVAGAGGDDNAAFTIDGDQLRINASPDFEAQPSYSVRVRTTDAGGLSFEQAFTVTVLDVNEPPVALDGGLATPEDTPVGITLEAFDPDGNPLTYTVIAPPAHGTLSGTGADLTYTPDDDFNGDDSFVFVAGDGSLQSNPAVVALSVLPVNDAPSFTRGADVTVDEDAGAQTVSGWATDITAGPADESGQLLVFEVSNDHNALFSAQPALAPDGTLTFTPADDAFGSATVTVLLIDNGGTANGGQDRSAAQTFTLTVNPVNDAPIALDDTALTDEDNAVTLDVLANDTPGPANESDQTLTVVSAGPAEYGTVTINPDGTVTYTPDLNYNGPDSFSYTARDSGDPPLEASASGIVLINPINDAPVATDGSATLAEDATPGASIDLRALVSDVETADADLIYTIVTPPASSAGTLNTTATNGVYLFTPAADFHGTASFTYQVTDTGDPAGNPANARDSEVKQVTLTVTPVNDDPVTGDVGPYTLDEEAALKVVAPGVLVNASDVDGDLLTAELVSDPSHGTLSLRPDGSFTYAHDGSETTADSFTFRVFAGTTYSGVATASLIINPVNDAPVVKRGTLTAAEDTAGSGTLVAQDVDSPSLTFSVVGGPVHGSVNLDSATGAYTYTPDTDFHGSDSFTFLASDGSLDSNPGIVAITVTEVNDAPVAGDDSALTFEDTPVFLDVLGNDLTGPDNEVKQTLTVTAVTQGGHGTVAINPDGTVTYLPDADFNGTDSFTYTITDDGTTNGGSDPLTSTATVYITVEAVNDAPIFTPGPDQTVVEDAGTQTSAWATGISAGPADESGQALTFAVSNDHNALFSAQPAIAPDGTLTFTPAAHAHGTATVTVVLEDDGGTAVGGVSVSAIHTFTITVDAQADAPTLNLSNASGDEAGGIPLAIATALTDTDGSESLSIRISDVPANVTLSAGTDNGDGSWTLTPAELAGLTLTAPDEADFNLTVAATATEASNGSTATTSGTLPVTVANVAATVTLDPVAAIDENGVATLTGTITDPGALDTFTLDVNWGDPLSPDNVETYTFGASATGTQTFTLTHQYLDDNPTATASDTYTITAAVVDNTPVYDPPVLGIAVLLFADELNDNFAAVETWVADLYALIGESGGGSVPHTFTNGQALDADELNDNFAAVETMIHDLYALIEESGGGSVPHTFTNPLPGGQIQKDSATRTVTVNNVAPEIASVNAPVIDEAGTATLSGSFTDVGTLDTHAVVIDWGDGTTSNATVDATDRTFTADHLYPDDDPTGTPTDTYTIGVTVTDDDNGSHSASTTVTVNNVAPASAAGADQTVQEGDLVTLSGAFTDQGADDGHKQEWSVVASNGQDVTGLTIDNRAADSDGSGGSGFTFTPDDNGTYTVTYTVTDDDGGTHSDNTVITVNNVAPSPAIDTISATRVEGTQIDVAASATDPAGANDTLTYAYEVFKDGATTPFASDSGVGLTSFSFTPDDDGSYEIRLTVSDEDGGSTTVTQTITVDNVAPIATLGHNGPVDEGSPVTVSFSNPSDPSSVDTAAGFRYSFAGSAAGLAASYAEAGTATSASFTFDDNGTYTLHGRVFDKDGAYTDYTTSVVVYNVAPVAGPITAPLDPIAVDTTVTVSASFTDVGTADTHTAVWDWGDGTTSAGTVDQADDAVTGSHTYTAAGVYTVTLTVTDDDTGEDTELFQYVVVYDPSAGFVTGGGWIDSPAGAYAPDPTLAGKANFGFVAKYKKGKSTPDGQSQFHFKVADFKFESTSYDWLVVAGSKAQFKGEGTVNGTGTYGFFITAADGDLKPDDSFTLDLFRIKIWDKANGDAIVYDNLPGGADDADPTTALGGGSIVIHDGKPLQAAGLPTAPSAGVGTLTSEQLRPIVEEAIARWEATGLTAEEADRLRSTPVFVTDLGDPYLGMQYPAAVWIDDDAAGWGWFVDATPWEDGEFTTPGDQGEQGRIDLLTAVMHELGHVLGHDDLDAREHADDLMSGALTAGTRRLPALGRIEQALPAAAALRMDPPAEGSRPAATTEPRNPAFSLPSVSAAPLAPPAAAPTAPAVRVTDGAFSSWAEWQQLSLALAQSEDKKR